MRQVALAAGTVPDVAPTEAVSVARDTGFDLVGLRLSRERVGPAALDGIRSATVSARVAVLDVEVVRLSDGAPAGAWTWLLDAAEKMGARSVLTVVDGLSAARAAAELAPLCDLAAERGLTIGLEFMRFTAVRTWSEACDLLGTVDHPKLTLVVDTLHLARTSGDAAALTAAAAGRIGWIQVCDAPAEGPTHVPADGPVDDEDLAREARHHRLLPGEGSLPLASMLAALPSDVPLSLEVQSDVLVAAETPVIRASRGRLALRHLLDDLGRSS